MVLEEAIIEKEGRLWDIKYFSCIFAVYKVPNGVVKFLISGSEDGCALVLNLTLYMKV